MNSLQRKSAFTLALLLALRRHRRRRRYIRKWWIHPSLTERSTKRKFYFLHNKLKEDPVKFSEYYRMSIDAFERLLCLVKDVISKKNTVMRECVCAEQRLAVTLRYLGSGHSFTTIHQEFLLGRSTIAGIIRDTCAAIWATLQPEFMKNPTSEDWLEISKMYDERANFPHCVGTITGKHIRIVKPWRETSEVFSHKKVFSIIVIALVDVNYSFRYINVGGNVREGISHLFKTTELGKQIYAQTLNLPHAKPLPDDPLGEPVPYVFIAQEAFAPCQNLLRPFPGRNLTSRKNVFNYRLLRARRCADFAFGILENKWQIFQRSIDVSVDVLHVIIKACCVLHNFVKHLDGYNFEDTLFCRLENISECGLKGNRIGLSTRDRYTDYFNSSHGSVPWQNACIKNI